MAQWALLLLFIALGLGGYWLMGRVDGFLFENLTRNTDPARKVEGWTPAMLCLIMGKGSRQKKEGKGRGNTASTADAPNGCAG